MSVKEVKLCLLGESGVGKSSIVHRFVYNDFNKSLDATIGASFMTKSLEVDGKVFKYQIWDTAGQEKFRALAPMYYRNASAAVLVYDMTSRDSYSRLQSWITELNRHGPQQIVIAIAGNKSDLEDLREVTQKEAEIYAANVGAVFVETSAKTAVNVAALFHEISKRLPGDDARPIYQRDIIQVSKKRPPKKKCC